MLIVLYYAHIVVLCSYCCTMLILLSQGQEDKLVALYQPVRRTLNSKVETDTAHLLAAREGTDLFFYV